MTMLSVTTAKTETQLKLALVVETIASATWDAWKVITGDAAETRAFSDLRPNEQHRFRQAAEEAALGLLGWVDATAIDRTVEWVARFHEIDTEYPEDAQKDIRQMIRAGIVEFPAQKQRVYREGVR